MAYTNFAPSGYGQISALNGASSSQAIPGGGGATLIVTNYGPNPAVVLLGSSSVAVTLATGVGIPPGQSLPLAVGSNGYIAVMGVGGTAVLNLAQGT